MHPVEIIGPRLLLREFEHGDLAATMAVVGDDEVTRTLSFDTKDEAAARKYLDDAIARARQEPRPDYYLAVVERSTGQLVGFARLGLGGHQAADLGYAIRADRWGRGYATEAARLLTAFGFDELGLHRISAASGPGNLASQRVAEHLGMHPEGRIRDHVYTNGAWRDSVTFAVLATEWSTQSTTADLGPAAP